MFRTSKESLKGRIVKKAIGKTSWFRSKKRSNKNEEDRDPRKTWS